MLKILGILLIVTGAGGIGNYLCGYLNHHLKQLIECREIFSQMEAGREYLRLPYAELLRRTAKGKTKVFQELLSDIAEEMEQNREADAGVLWEKELVKRKDELLFDEEERELFTALAKSLMLEGNHTKVSEIYFLQLEDQVVQAMEEKKDKQKLYGTVSVLGGLFLYPLFR